MRVEIVERPLIDRGRLHEAVMLPLLADHRWRASCSARFQHIEQQGPELIGWQALRQRLAQGGVEAAMGPGRLGRAHGWSRVALSQRMADNPGPSLFSGRNMRFAI